MTTAPTVLPTSSSDRTYCVFYIWNLHTATQGYLGHRAGPVLRHSPMGLYDGRCIDFLSMDECSTGSRNLIDRLAGSHPGKSVYGEVTSKAKSSMMQRPAIARTIRNSSSCDAPANCRADHAFVFLSSDRHFANECRKTPTRALHRVG